MAAKSEKLYNSFIKGLVTEANPLTYPENASLDEDNFVLERNGSRSRRLGVDFEAGYSLISTGLSSSILQNTQISSHKWENPNGDTSVSIGVIRVYNRLWFINLLDDTPSTALLNGGTYITVTNLLNAAIETAVINNSLLIVSSDLNKPVLLTYNTTTQLVTQAEVTIETRDIWGVADSLAIDSRPATISDLHRYNLKNQGWSSKITSTCGTDAIDCTFTNIAVYPSNADVWTLGKIGDSLSANFEKYDPATMKKNSIDNAPAPIGSFILNAFSRGLSRQTVSGLTSLPVDTESGRFTTITTYASRVFYSGITSTVSGGDSHTPNYSGYVFFSRTIRSNEELGKCYQEADPTSPNISDIVDTDGGTIQIPEATKIVKLIATKSSLIVMAENGIWEVYGDTGGFLATSFQLSKISSVGIINPKAVVESNGTIVYFSKAGIYTLSQEQVSGRYQAQNISLVSIQTFYNNLSDIAKNNAKGFYDERENRIRWLYNDVTGYSATNYINNYNRELVLDLTLQAFYPQSISPLTSASPYVNDYIDIPGYAVNAVTEGVYAGADVVDSAASGAVIVTADDLVARSSQFSFLTLYGTTITLSKYNNSSFMDWFAANGVGVDYSSYLVTGYETFGEHMRNKQIPYIFFYFDRTEDGYTQVGSDLVLNNQSSCMVQSQWNWANSASGGKWGTPFQVYRFNRPYIPSGATDTFDYGDRVIVTKNKLRGAGRALSLKIYSVVGKDIKLLGWSLVVTGDGKV